MSEIKGNYKYLTSEENEIYKINLIILNQNTKKQRIHEFLTNIMDIFVSYIKLSKEFSKKLENLAMKLKPNDKTFEGQIVQVFQSILLFNSNSLNEMIKDMNSFYEQESKICYTENNIDDFTNYKEVYSKQYRKTLYTYKIYENGVENLENYLIKKELGLVKEDNKNKDNIKILSKNKETFLNDLKILIDVSAGNIIILLISITPIILIPITIISAVSTAIIFVYLFAFNPFAFAKFSSKVTANNFL